MVKPKKPEFSKVNVSDLANLNADLCLCPSCSTLVIDDDAHWNWHLELPGKDDAKPTAAKKRSAADRPKNQASVRKNED